MNSTLIGSIMNTNSIATAVPSFSWTDTVQPSGISTANEIEIGDDANALMMALDMACCPSFSHLGDNVRTKDERETPLVLARHGKQYQQALQKAIKRSSSFQQSAADDINEMFSVANQRRPLHDNDKTTGAVEHLGVDHLFKEALINVAVTPQVPAGDTKPGRHAPHPPCRHAPQLSKYVTAEAIMAEIKDVNLSALSSPNIGNDNQPSPPLEFKLRPRSRTLEALGHQMSDPALLDTNSTAPTGSGRSNSFPSYSSSTSGGLKSITEATCTSLSMPSLPYPQMQPLCKDKKSLTSPSASTTLTPSLSLTKEPTMRRSCHVVASTSATSAGKNSHCPAYFLQRKSSSSGVLTRSFSALSLRRSTSTSTFKNSHDNLGQRSSPIDGPKKVSPSHPNLRRSASSKSGSRRRSSRGSLSGLRRHSRVGIADASAPTMIPGPNAVW